jgi:hypothetical protein
MKRLRALSVLTAGLLVAACAEDDDPQRQLERYVDGYASTVCSALVTCSCSAPSTAQDCAAAYRTMLEYAVAEEMIQSPARAPVAAAIDACLGDLRAAVQGCPGPTRSEVSGGGFEIAKAGFEVLVRSCEPRWIFAGIRASGERCASPRDCAPGLGCDELTYTCEPYATVDSSCATIPCAEGLYCTPALACATQPAAGQACPDGVCAAGSTCVDVDGLMTCVAPHAATESCTDGAGCVAGTYCDWDAGVCTAPLADGAECTDDFECEHLWCRSGTCADPGFCAISRLR